MVLYIRTMLLYCIIITYQTSSSLPPPVGSEEKGRGQEESRGIRDQEGGDGGIEEVEDGAW